jgi:hypothetical protein
MWGSSKNLERTRVGVGQEGLIASGGEVQTETNLVERKKGGMAGGEKSKGLE